MLKLGLLTIGLLCPVLGDFLWAGGGASSTGVTGSVLMFNGTRWVNVTTLPTANAYTSLASFQGALYHIGGRTQSGVDQAVVEKYDGSWYTMTNPMLQARAMLRSVVTSSPTGAPLLCAVGGQQVGPIYLASMECFNGSTSSTWVAGPSMTISRASFGLVKINSSTDNSTICAVGGVTQGGVAVASWECLGSISGTWQRQTSGNLTYPRQAFGIAYFSEANNGVGMICIAGGFINNLATNILECTTSSNAWQVQTQSPMAIARANAPMVKYMGQYCMVGGVLIDGSGTASVECFDVSVRNWTSLQDMPTVRFFHGAANYDPPTQAPTKAPTQAPTTAAPTQLPTQSPTTLAPTTLAPTTAVPTTSAPTRSPTHSPTRVPTSSPTLAPTVFPTAAPTLPGCPALNPIENSKGSCAATPHGGSCTQTCPYGVASGSEARMCLVGVWGALVCNSQVQGAAAAPNDFFQVFPLGSWQGIISIVAICVVFLLCLVMIIYACWRCRRKKNTEHHSSIPMSQLPPYTPQGELVFPDQQHVPPPDFNAGDPFAADKNHVDLDVAAQQDAAEKVRREQEAAFERARLSRASDDGKHESNGYGGVSRLTVT